MSSKSKSPEAAQKKAWKLELKSLESARRKVVRDITAEQRRSLKTVQDANYAAIRARRKHEKNCERLEAVEERNLTSIDRRIGILKGRVGI